tara:strand:- start:1264 stop:1746 length:483 start_codon:yes stop_codon:yes gene_type:complete
MPSFDITSSFDKQEVINAVDQMSRELINRYDFRDTNTSSTLTDNSIIIKSSTDERLNAADQVLREKFAKRNVSIKFLGDFNDEKTPSESKRTYTLKSGIDKDIAKIIVKDLKQNFKKVQSSIQDSSIRVTGKKRDDLQDVISFLKSNDYKIFLNYGNFRD